MPCNRQPNHGYDDDRGDYVRPAPRSTPSFCLCGRSGTGKRPSSSPSVSMRTQRLTPSPRAALRCRSTWSSTTTSATVSR
jgi:hypothetical protein